MTVSFASFGKIPIVNIWDLLWIWELNEELLIPAHTVQRQQGKLAQVRTLAISTLAHAPWEPQMPQRVGWLYCCSLARAAPVFRSSFGCPPPPLRLGPSAVQSGRRGLSLSEAACVLGQGQPPAGRTELLLRPSEDAGWVLPSQGAGRRKEGLKMIPPGVSQSATALFSSPPRLFKSHLQKALDVFYSSSPTRKDVPNVLCSRSLSLQRERLCCHLYLEDW